MSRGKKGGNAGQGNQKGGVDAWDLAGQVSVRGEFDFQTRGKKATDGGGF